MAFLEGYGHFLRTAESLQWDEQAVDLSADTAAWPTLPGPLKDRLEILLAGFCVGEERVAGELDPFSAAAQNEDASACFRLQQRDEARHARFFDRVARDVMKVPGGATAARRRRLRRLLSRDFLALFEIRLEASAREVAVKSDSLASAVALYHLVLEGVVFTAGQLALLDLLEDAPLPGIRAGTELVLRDERWHIGFGVRLLDDLGLGGIETGALLDEADEALCAWGEAVPDAVRARVRDLHRRRLGAARLRPGERSPARVGAPT